MCYFDQYLSGAQADQEVLKDIIREKLPRLANHLENLEIEISTVTLNWFLAIFFDAVPFEVSPIQFFIYLAKKYKNSATYMFQVWK